MTKNINLNENTPSKTSFDSNTLSVTPASIAANIVNEVYFTAEDGIFGANIDGSTPGVTITTEHSLLTFCVLSLRNGFTVVGSSACVDPNIFNADKGKQIAREKAVEHIWPLMGYSLKQQIHESNQ